MAQQQSPWLEGAYGWNFGESGWNSGMDQNLLKFSFMFDRNIDSIVASLPAAVNGQAHYLTSDNRLYFVVGTTYFSTPVPKWFVMTVRNTGDMWQFNGASLVQIDSPQQLDSRLDAIELTVTTLGTAAFEDIAFFATQAALDVAVSDAAAYTDAASYVRQVSTVDDLRLPGSEGRFANDKVELLGYFSTNPGVGGGELYWDSVSTEIDNGGTVFAVSGIPTGRWVRPLGKAVFLEWFGIIGDGVTIEDAKIQAAVAATPQGGTLFMPNREMTVLMDIPSGQVSRWQSAVNFNKSGMRVLGSHSCTFKLQDFTSAYVSYTGVSGLAAFRASASDVEVSGLNIDANADHHYETDGGGFKWFEGEGPTGKRPPSGVIVTIEDGANKITGVRICKNKIYRPLAGVYVAGNLSIALGTSLDDPTFFDGTLSTDIIEDCEVSGNEVSFARGNDYIFITGVRDSVIRGNTSINSMYHNARFYAGVDSCIMEDNHAYMNYAEIAARWNETDLGYWRSNNPAEVGGYLIERAGYAIGSTAAQTSANSGNVRRCSMINNEIWYNSNTEDGSIVDTTQGTLGSFFVWQVVNGILVSGNESHNSPFNGLVFTNSIIALNPVAQGVVFSNNRINNSRFEFIFSLGTGPAFVDNTGTNCTLDGNGKGVIYCQGGAKIYKNDLIWQRTTANTNDIIKFVTYGTVGLPFISDNNVFGYTGTRISKLSTDIVHGTDGGGVPITLLAGWVAGSEAALITVNCSGYVQLHGRINSAAGGTDTFASLNGNMAMYRPPLSIRYPTWQDSGTPGVVLGNASAAGSLFAARGALAAGTPFAITANWRVDLRLPF